MLDYADFLFGYQALIGLASPTVSQLRSWGWAGYLQDDWKVNHKLSLNLGLRYEFDTPIYEANNLLANFNPSNPTVPIQASSSNRYTINPNTRDFGPRFGVSFAADDKTVIRGGFGISYSHWNRVGSNYLSMNPPNGVVALQVAAPSTADYSNVQSGFPANMVSPTNFSPWFDTMQYMPPSSPDTQVRSWFFGVQRDLTHSWLLDLTYVGNYGLNEIIVNDINQATTAGSAPLNLSLGGTASTSRVPYAYNYTVAGILPEAYSDYDGLQAKVEKRFSQGLYLLESFTWSKDIDIAAQALDGGGNCDNCGNGIPSVQNIYNVAGDRGISAYNHPLVNTTTLVWTLPVGKGQLLLPNASRLLDEFVGGWQATGIVQGRSGDPLDFAYNPNNDQAVSPLTSVDGRNSYRPNISGAGVAAHRTLDPDGYPQYLNVAAFSSPALAPPSGSTTFNAFGDYPRNSIRGYDYWDVDMGLSKDFALTERYRPPVPCRSLQPLQPHQFRRPEYDPAEFWPQRYALFCKRGNLRRNQFNPSRARAAGGGEDHVLATRAADYGDSAPTIKASSAWRRPLLSPRQRKASVVVGAAEVVAAPGADQFAVVAGEAMTASGADLAMVIDGCVG